MPSSEQRQGLDVTDVTVSYDEVAALSGVSMQVRHHEIVGVIGPNGAGKSTLLDVVCGVRKPDSGRVAWAGRRISRTKPHQLGALGIARVRQHPVLDEDVSILTNVLAGSERRERSGLFPRKEAGSHTSPALVERARELLRAVGALEYADDLPREVPWATRGRVHLAKALITEPELVVLDEPGAGLSGPEVAELGRILRGLTRRTTFLLVDHRMDLVLQVCDQVHVLVAGRILATGTPEQIRADPDVQSAYLHED
ncbi:putative High-affinity branched-chain amino acid transport protein (ABC superfamily, ATP-binding) [metagenome]|uniref:Putative High-affinity branched-chain amino acid transport protein (ABC superfamily, ATP-binding) n=1 Tax=metagenome TaxID=256318 RepID=A0A2P2C7B2_9ZZZZ